jgi:hypothetical protein
MDDPLSDSAETIVIAAIQPYVPSGRDQDWLAVQRSILQDPQAHEVLAGLFHALEYSEYLKAATSAAKQRRAHIAEIARWSRRNPVLCELMALHGAAGVLDPPRLMRPGSKKPGRPRNELLRRLHIHLGWLVAEKMGRSASEGFALLGRVWHLFGPAQGARRAVRPAALRKAFHAFDVELQCAQADLSLRLVVAAKHETDPKRKAILEAVARRQAEGRLSRLRSR